MNPTGSLCANNWARSTSLVPPGNGLQTNLSLDPSSFYDIGIEMPFKEINEPSRTQSVIPCESNEDIKNTDQETSKLQDWDPSAMLSNLSFLEEKIHQLQDVVHLIANNKKCQPFEQPRELVTQEQQLVTADLTSIIVQLISTAGTSNGVQPQNNIGNKLFDQSIHKDVPNNCEMEQNHNMDEHEHKDEEDMEEGENLPPGSYEILQLEKEEILAPHTHFCTICGKGFKRDANLRMHMRGHGDEYKTPAALAKPHKETGSEPKLIKRYSCPYGGCKRNKDHKKFQPLKTILCVKNHYKRTHCDKSYTCSRCHTKKFSVIADLKTHEKHCGKDKWLCSCGTTFSRKDKLFGHIALFQGHTPAIPLEDNKGLAEPPDRCATKENSAMVGNMNFCFGSNPSSENGVDNIMDVKGNIDDPISYFSSLNFEGCNFGAFNEFSQPSFEDSEGSFSFLMPSSFNYAPKSGGESCSDTL
ncbi:unnamed protein product [Lathyrus sativus]|nr:unnamed protein product [Lathyrus sativus]